MLFAVGVRTSGIKIVRASGRTAGSNCDSTVPSDNRDGLVLLDLFTPSQHSASPETNQFSFKDKKS